MGQFCLPRDAKLVEWGRGNGDSTMEKPSRERTLNQELQLLSQGLPQATAVGGGNTCGMVGALDLMMFHNISSTYLPINHLSSISCYLFLYFD